MTAIRNEETIPIVQSHISNIADVVDGVLSAAEGSIEDLSSYQAILREKILPVARILDECKDKLMQASQECQAADGQPGAKLATQKLPPIAFQIARETKELVSVVESIGTGAGDEDFS